MLCKKCGQPVDEGQQSCPNCGTEVGANAPETAESTVTPETVEETVEDVAVDRPAEEDVAPNPLLKWRPYFGWGALGFFVLFLVFVIVKPSLKLDLLFWDECPLWGVMFLVSLVLALLFVTAKNQHRVSKIYLTPDGKLDVDTPREYLPLEINGFSKWLGKENKFKQKDLRYFKFENGVVTVENSKGDSLEAPLADLTFSYKMNKDGFQGEWYVYQYRIEDKEGNKVQFNRHNFLFNEEEWDDIQMILSLSGTVKEGKISKIGRRATSALEKIQDFDFSDIVGSAIEGAGTTITEKVGQMAQKKIVDKFKKSKKSWFKKVWNWILWIAFVIYVIAVICVNFSNWFGSSDSADSAYDTDLTENTDTDYEAIDESSDSSADVLHFSGTIDGVWVAKMELNTETGEGSYYLSVNGPESALWLQIAGVDDLGRYLIEEYTGGLKTGLFTVRISDNGDVNGWYKNYEDDSEVPVSMELE